MSDDRTYRVHSAEREVTPAFTLNQIGKVAYQRASDEDRYRRLNLVTAQLMCSLTVEAVLNRVGHKLFFEDASEPQLWDAVERLGPKPKLLAIAERAGLEIDFSEFPFQHFGPIFRFRNKLAHAKFIRLATTDIPSDALNEDNWLDEDKVPALQADWEKVCSLETAKVWRDAVYAISAALCEAADCLDPVIISDNASWGGMWS